MKADTPGQAAQLGFAGTDVPTIIKNDFDSLLKPPTTVIATVLACAGEIFVNKGSKKSVTTHCSLTSFAKSVPTEGTKTLEGLAPARAVFSNGSAINRRFVGET